MNNCFVILAAGKSSRFSSNTPKPYIQYKGDILINHSINKAILSKKFSKIVVAVNRKHKKYYKMIKNDKIKIIYGGKTRADSSRICLEYLKKFNPKNILIHDAARPEFSLKMINKLIVCLKDFDGAIPVIKSLNSIKSKSSNNIKNLDREKIFFSQTPQAFKFKILYDLRKNYNKNTTDDSSILIDNKNKIKLIKGEKTNVKITTKDDIWTKKNLFYGIGFDIHRLIPKKKLFLGGLYIRSKIGTLGHSDGDPVLHALTDAILGACRMGDIGEKFSDKDKQFKNIRSTILLKRVIDEMISKKYYINNIDINIITEFPKIKNYKEKIKRKISKICMVSTNKINIKGKTTEKLGIIGKEKAIACEVLTSVSNYG
tara:strand:+ start:3057 stop:4172 length:1116 start_codon:yes stop_codon:yes gene_type:complete